MKTTVKQIFDEIQGLNPSTEIISSLGSYISQSGKIVAESIYMEVISYLEKDSVAFNILTSSERYTEKQLWVIAYALVNTEYAEVLGSEIARREAKENAKVAASKAKLAANKENSQEVLEYVKANGRLLKNYYSYVKRTRAFASEFYSKKFTMKSAESFINK